MTQKDRMNSATNEWEADPWDASDEVADAQLTGFRLRALEPIKWCAIRNSDIPVFGIDLQKLLSADVEFHASHEGEALLLMRSPWHGFPDPPEWRLASKSLSIAEAEWTSWGYFADLPDAWEMPQSNAP